MNRVNFWALQRSIQERFVASTEGAAAPAPLAVRPLARDSAVLGWGLFGLAGLIGAMVSLRLGFGDLGSHYALTPVWFCAVHAGLFGLSAFAFLKAAARHVSTHAVPYRPGLYLFPVGVIDARTPQFAVHRVSEQTEAQADNARRCLRVAMGGATFEFPTRDAAGAELAARTVSELRDRLANSGPDSSAREQSLVDPLVDNGFKNPFSPTESLRKATPFWVRIWPVLALVWGVLLGGAAWRVRNTLSERRLYAAARAADNTQTYRAYLARGGSNAGVQALLLPRTELRDALKNNGVAAIEQFRDTHPQTKIGPEVEAALQQVLMKELAGVQAVGTLTALKAFSTRYARYPFLVPAVDQAINARIESALVQLKPGLAPNQSHLLPFMERLLRFTAKHGPEVLVRFQMKPTETLAAAEKALRQSAYFAGEKSLPGQYFDAAHEAPREAAIAATLVAALSEHLPPDFVTATPAPTLDAALDPKPTVPTLLITYHTEMSGAFTSRRPRLALSGIGMIGRASFEIPGDADSLTFKLSVWRAPDLKAITDTATAQDLYDTMATEAFKRFTKKYLATLFAEH
ncbi:MAG: hypothetical protein ABI488_15280 [Polyangiaceae bacterium]